jgi:hypothetical protein
MIRFFAVFYKVKFYLLIVYSRLGITRDFVEKWLKKIEQ